MDSKRISAVASAAILGLILLQFQFTTTVSTANLSTLRVAQVIFRHGAKNIDETYPLDPYRNESYWFPGYSQLTNIGKLQGFNLGLYLRERYNGFVGDTYNVKDIHVQSSDPSRTIETAHSVMAGFYLPNDLPSGLNLTYESLFKSQEEIPLPWKNVPVHTIPQELDNIVRQRPNICPRYNHLLNKLKSEENEFITEEKKRFYEYVSENTGLNITNGIDYNMLMDSIYVERFYNFTLPSWTAPVLNSTISKNTYFTQLTQTYEMKRLRTGPLLERLLQNMLVNDTLFENHFQRSRDGQKKMYFFSGHDETMAGVLNTLEMYDTKRPAFTSSILIELHQDISSGNFYVEFYYRNETDRDPYKLEMPNCSQPCLLSNFRKLVEPYIPLDWREECQLLEESGSISGAWIALMIVTVWVVMFIALQCWIRSARNRRTGNQQRDSYTHLK